MTYNSGANLKSVSSGATSFTAATDAQLEAGQFFSLQGGAVTFSSKLAATVASGLDLSITSGNGFSLSSGTSTLTWTAGAEFQSFSTGVTSITATGSTLSVTALQTLADGQSLAITNAGTGDFLLQATGVDAATSLRAGTTFSSASTTFQTIQGNTVNIQSYIGGSLSIVSVGQVQYSTGTNPNAFIAESAQTTTLLGQTSITLSGGTVTYTANGATSTSTKDTTLAATGVLSITGASVIYASGGTTNGIFQANSIAMTGNPISWTSTATTNIMAQNGNAVFTSGGLTTFSADGAGGSSSITSTTTDTTLTAGRQLVLQTTAAGANIALQTGAGDTKAVTITSVNGVVDMSAGGILTLQATGTAVGQGIVTLSASGDVFGLAFGGLSISSNAIDSTDQSGIRLLTTDTDGDIYLVSYLGQVTVSGTSVSTVSNDYVRMRATKAITQVAGTSTTGVSNIGALEIHGTTGFNLQAGSTNDNFLKLSSTGPELFQAEDAITISATGNMGTANKDVSITALTGAVRFGTANDKAITGTTAAGDWLFSAGGIFSLQADTTLTLQAATNLPVLASTDIFLTTQGGPIQFTTPDSQFKILGTTGNVTFSSGGDLSVTAKAMSETFTAGTVLTSTALLGNGYISSTGTVSLTSTLSSLLLTADGERNLPRDGLTITSASNILLTAPTAVINLNAENLFAIGREQRPMIENWANGNAAQLGWTLDAFGDIDITTGAGITFTAATAIGITGRDYLELSSDTSVAVVAQGAAGQPLHNVDIKATIGSVSVRGGIVSTQSANRMTISSSQHGITLTQSSTAATDTVAFAATTGFIELDAKQIDLDTTAFQSNVANLIDWRASNGLTLVTNAGDGGKMAFASQQSITATSNGAMAIRTLGANGDITITAQGTTGVQLVASGSSGSPVVLASGSSTTLRGATGVTISGDTGVFVQADDASGNDLLGTIALTANTITTSSSSHTDITAGRSVLIATQQPGATAAPLTLAASRDIRIQSNDDSLFQAQSHTFTTTTGGIHIFTTQASQGDVKFLADSTSTWYINNEEALWETHNDFLGNVLQDITFTSTGDRDDVGLLLSANGKNAEAQLRSTYGSVITNSGGATSILSGVLPNGATASVVYHSNVGGEVDVQGTFLMHTTNNAGNIVIQADNAEVDYQFADFFASAGASMSFSASGDQSVYSEQTVYGISASYGTQVIVTATNNTLSMHAGTQIHSTLAGSLAFQAATPVGTSNGVNAGISFDSTGPEASLTATALDSVTMFANRDFTIEATDPAGGVVSIYSSGSAAFTAQLNMDFSNLGGVGSIFVATGPTSAYTSAITITAPENFAVASSLRGHFAADDPSGANIRLHSEASDVTVQQLGQSQNGLGVELRANEGNIFVDAQTTGSIVFSAVEGVEARANDAFVMQSNGGGANAIQFRGGQLTVQSERGTVALAVTGALSFTAQANIEVQTTGLVDSDITASIAGATTIASTAGVISIGSNYGDARFESNSGAEIVLSANFISVDAGGHFAIPFENRDVPVTCLIEGQIARFTSTGLVPSLLGLTPSRLVPNPPFNKGKLCVCHLGSWRCARF